MKDPTVEFFHELRKRRHEPLLRRVSGTVRFDLDHNGGTDHWLVTVNKGDITVSESDAKADAVVRTDRTWFDRAVAGQANPMAAVLRGAATIEGDVELLVYALRLFPGPVPVDDRRRTVGTGRKP
jgi:putative sterol carrier protein